MPSCFHTVLSLSEFFKWEIYLLFLTRCKYVFICELFEKCRAIFSLKKAPQRVPKYLIFNKELYILLNNSDKYISTY